MKEGWASRHRAKKIPRVTIWYPPLHPAYLMLIVHRNEQEKHKDRRDDNS